METCIQYHQIKEKYFMANIFESTPFIHNSISIFPNEILSIMRWIFVLGKYLILNIKSIIYTYD